MNPAPRSSLGASLTLKRRRGRRNLKRATDTDTMDIVRSEKKSAPRTSRPSSSGAIYSSASSTSAQQLLTSSSDGEEEGEPLAHIEHHAGRLQTQVEDSSRNLTELTRSMTEDLISTRPSILDWDGTGADIEDPTDLQSELSSLEDDTQNLPLDFINQLPNELLTLIFSYGSQLAPFEPLFPLTPIPPFKTPAFLEVVLGVCSRWRQLAKNTPALWTSILVTRSRNDIDSLPVVSDFRSCMKSITNALQSSLNLPLDITLDCTHISSKTALRQLAAESDRWRSLSLIVPTVQSLPAVLSHLEGVQAPNLESLVISANKFHDGEFPTIIPPPFLKSSARLSKVSLNRVGLRWTANPLHNLTSLELRFVLWPSHSDFRSLFSNSPGLENLKMHFDAHAFARLDRSNGGFPVRPIKIPHLRTLELRFIYHDSSSTHNVIPLLQLFTLPALEELTLKDFGTSEWCRSLVYFRYYAKSYPKLWKLTLDRVKDIIYVDSSLVRAFPRLTSLHLVGVYSSAFCRLLCGARTQDLDVTGLPCLPSHEVEVWPGLKELVIEQDPQGRLDLVAEAVRARVQMGRSLQTLQLDRIFFNKAEQEGNGELLASLKELTEVRHV